MLLLSLIEIPAFSLICFILLSIHILRRYVVLQSTHPVTCRVARCHSIMRTFLFAHYSLFKAVNHLKLYLENDIVCQLFVRSSRGVKLTKQGEILYKYAKQALTFIRTGEKKVSEYENLNYGEVIVGVSDTLCKYYLTPYLEKFNNKYPNIRIQIKCHNTPEKVKLLKDGLIDLALVTSPLQNTVTFIPYMLDNFNITI